jgi:cystathionine beta-lyase/cystathionine gamma-synthase
MIEGLVTLKNILIKLSIGLEDLNDLIEDVKKTLSK